VAYVLDYSEWRPNDVHAMRATGVVGVVRYIAPASWAWPKAITLGELDGLLGAGIEVAFNFERNPNDYVGGFSAGNANGIAIAQAMHELGLASDQPVLVSYDTDIPVSQFPLCADYHRGVIAGCGGHRPIDGYGENALLEYLAQLGLLTRDWMSESQSFPGNQFPSPHTVLQQHYGLQVPGLPGAYDVNTIIKPDWGQTPYASGSGIPSSLPKEEPMLYADKVDASPNRERTVAIIDPASGNIVLAGPGGLTGVTPTSTGFGPVVFANYPAGEAYVGSDKWGPNGFVLISKQADGQLAERHYTFNSNYVEPALPAGPRGDPGPQGAKGDPGPQGPAGTSSVNVTELAAHLKIEAV
jgi:hypothetical protein